MRSSPNTIARAFLIAMLALLGALTPAGADIYQYAVTHKPADGAEITAYLWVPPQTAKIRSLLIAGMATSVEPMLCQAPEVREACAEKGIAILYLSPHPDAVLAKPQTLAVLDEVTALLAKRSGHPELAAVPFFAAGHSVSTLFASRLAATRPSRCAGVILHKGGIALDSPVSKKALLGVPILAIKGQFEEYGPGPSGVLRADEDRTAAYKSMNATLSRLNGESKRSLAALIVIPGGTHFPWLPMEGELVAQFLRGASSLRVGQGPDCLDVSPAADGAFLPSIVGEGGPAFWLPDVKLARRVNELHALLKLEPQFVAFTSSAGKVLVPGTDLRLRFTPEWVSADTFRVQATFLDSAPAKYPAQEKATHAATPPAVIATGGQIEEVAPGTFRFALSTRRRYEANLVAFHPGDAKYRYAEQAAIVGLPRKLAAGKAQTITFPAPGEMTQGTPLKLTATSDSGLPVRYFVEYGPAVVEGDMLKAADMPVHAEGSLTVSVLAYQFGSAVEPKVQSAEPVRREITLRRVPTSKP